jgi:hypothetical protein
MKFVYYDRLKAGCMRIAVRSVYKPMWGRHADPSEYQRLLTLPQPEAVPQVNFAQSLTVLRLCQHGALSTPVDSASWSICVLSRPLSSAKNAA